MKKVRPYFLPVVTLITALLTLGYRVVRQVILPTLTRKGNLLSSLFVLFTGLIEQVINFAEIIARMPRTFEIPPKAEAAWTFGRKYLRQGMLIAVWALFILSSLEWTSTQPCGTVQITVEQTVGATARVERNQKVFAIKDHGQDVAIVPGLTVRPLIYPPPLSTSRWLLLCALRI